MARNKTREEKIKSSYRLQNFRLQTTERQNIRDQSEFGYLSSHYIVQDLTKTLVYSLIILGLLVVAQRYLV